MLSLLRDVNDIPRGALSVLVVEFPRGGVEDKEPFCILFLCEDRFCIVAIAIWWIYYSDQIFEGLQNHVAGTLPGDPGYHEGQEQAQNQAHQLKIKDHNGGEEDDPLVRPLYEKSKVFLSYLNALTAPTRAASDS